jgi:hypothetical protein
MIDAQIPKTCSSAMFERFSRHSNIWPIPVPKNVRGESASNPEAYGHLEHGQNLFEQYVRELTLILEHFCSPLGKEQNVREGAEGEIRPPLRGLRVGCSAPPHAALTFRHVRPPRANPGASFSRGVAPWHIAVKSATELADHAPRAAAICLPTVEAPIRPSRLRDQFTSRNQTSIHEEPKPCQSSVN